MQPEPEHEPFNIKVPEPGFTYGSTKTYTHSVGLACCFRQWRAESHCHFLHGYALQVEFDFSCKELDHRNWAVDFGALKPLKGWLESLLDHKTLVAKDDPQISLFREMHIAKIIDMVEVESCGCEGTARIIYEYAEQWLKDAGFTHVVLERVTVKEHEGNGAYYGRV